jgi:hypothetical protein
MSAQPQIGAPSGQRPERAADQSERSLARRPATGALLLGSAVLAAVGSVVLGAAFGWPDVLEEPGTVALPLFAAAEGQIRFGFVLQLASSLLLVPAAIGVQRALTRGGDVARTLTLFGIAGALFQILGWVRWPIVVPGLSERFADPAATESERAATAAAYDVLNAYAGAALGEHLGWLFQAPWAIAVPVFALAAHGVPRWFALTGLGSAVVWAMLIVPEPYLAVLESERVALVAFIAYVVWFVWLAALGGLLVGRRVGPAAAEGSV